MTKRTLLLCVLCLLAFPFQSAAFQIGELDFYVTNEFLYRSNQSAGREHQFYEAFSLFSNYKEWSLGLTLRGNNFFKQSPNLTLGELQTDIYRKFLQYGGKNLKVTVGDFHSLLGRGLTLSVLENEDVFRERTILGGDVRYNRGRWDVRALGGVVRDETANQEWQVAGGEAAFEYSRNQRLGVHFSYIDDISTHRELGKRLTYSLSLAGSKFLKNFSYYIEAAGLTFRETNREDGLGLYGNITFSKGRVTSLVEFKRYKNFDNEMNNPPVADREDEISPLGDTTGGRLYFQYSFFEPDLILFFNFGRYDEYGDLGNNIYGGITLEDLWERLSLSVSYGVKDVLYDIKRTEAHLLYQFTGRLSAELSLKDKRYKDGNFVFQEIDHTFQVSYAPRLSLFVMHQYSHNKVMDLNHFYSGGVRVFLARGGVIELSGGTVRGGQVCSAGQCFVAPPFKGIKLSYHQTFK